MMQAYFAKKSQLTEEASKPMVTLHSGSWGYSKFIQNSKYSKVNQKPGPIFKTFVTHSYPLELCSSTMYPTLFAITTNTMCKATRWFLIQDSRQYKRLFVNKHFTFSHGPIYVQGVYIENQRLEVISKHQQSMLPHNCVNQKIKSFFFYLKRLCSSKFEEENILKGKINIKCFLFRKKTFVFLQKMFSNTLYM